MHEQRKLLEAEYFYSQMLKNASDYDAFAFNFSAFLSAARSAMQYALEEAKRRRGGQKWYDAHMSSQPVLGFFKDLRDINIHVQPVELSKSVTIQVPAALALTGTLTIEKMDAQGNLVEQSASDAASPPQSPQTQEPAIEHRYTLAEWNGPEDIPALARMYLDDIGLVIEGGLKDRYIAG